jgi:nucleoside-diphosphate-sugar epimerase
MNLVTGASGLLGSHIVEQLRRRSQPVRALVRTGSDTNWLETQDVELATGDITDPASLQAACQGVDCVYHAAAQVGDWGPWKQFVSVTIDGTANMLAAAIEANVKRFLHISSISTYGQVDGEGLVLDETAPLGQNMHRWSYYTRSKVAAEELVWQAYHHNKLPVTIVRPSWMYGPRDRVTIGRIINLIRTSKAKILGSGENRMNLVYAGNAAEACIMAAESDAAVGEVYNCSNDGVLTQQQLFNMLAETLGAPPVTRHVPFRLAYSVGFVLECFGHLFKTNEPPMVTRYAAWLMGRKCFFETRKIREQLGWQPKVSYEEGLPMTVRWYLQEVEGQSS